MIDLDGIKSRSVGDAEWLGMDDRRQLLKDRRALLAYVDALRAAAKHAAVLMNEATTLMVGDEGGFVPGGWHEGLADLRALLNPEVGK